MPRGGHPAPDSSRKSSRLRAPPEHKIVVFVRFLPSGPPFSGISSTKSRFLCAFASKFLPDSAPASDKPHSAEKRTPVWLAIWRTWAGFANSQLGVWPFAALIHIYVPIPVTAALSCCSDRRKSFGPSAPIAYATYVSPPDEAVAWQGRRCWIWLLSGPMHRSCKSPRARILVLGTSGAHWPARWPQFELTERVDKS